MPKTTREAHSGDPGVILFGPYPESRQNMYSGVAQWLEGLSQDGKIPNLTLSHADRPLRG